LRLADDKLRGYGSFMPMRVLITLMLAVGLGACSRAFDVLAALRNGQIVFVAEQARDECVLAVEISSQLERPEPPAPTDRNPSGLKQVWAHDMWVQTVGPNDACQNKFPITYGVTLRGNSIAGSLQVDVQQLTPEVIYRVNIRTRDNGYGSGKFILRNDGTVENLK